MIPQQGILTTALRPEPPSRTFPKTGSALFAEWERRISLLPSDPKPGVDGKSGAFFVNFSTLYCKVIEKIYIFASNNTCME